MTIRFLQTVPSESGYPFQPGQIIHVDQPSPFLLGLIDGVRAVAVKDTEPERAVATAPRKRGRPRKVRPA